MKSEQPTLYAALEVEFGRIEPQQFEDLKAALEEAIKRFNFTFNTEKALQDALETIIKSEGLLYDREYVLSPQDRPDFWLSEHGIAVEVKIQGSTATHLRQMKRYASHEKVKGVLLITAKTCSLPQTLDGKPIGGISLWRNRF